MVVVPSFIQAALALLPFGNQIQGLGLDSGLSFQKSFNAVCLPVCNHLEGVTNPLNPLLANTLKVNRHCRSRHLWPRCTESFARSS
jgi:hypothetical protein